VAHGGQEETHDGRVMVCVTAVPVLPQSSTGVQVRVTEVPDDVHEVQSHVPPWVWSAPWVYVTVPQLSVPVGGWDGMASLQLVSVMGDAGPETGAVVSVTEMTCVHVVPDQVRVMV